jgi:hypothetical protein
MRGRAHLLRQTRGSLLGLRAGALARLAAFVILAGHLLVAADALLVEHQTCPAHGEVMHASGGDHAAAPRREVVSIGTSEREAPSCGDERCCVTLNDRREGLTVPEPHAGAASLPMPARPLAGTDSATLASPVPILSFAPKSSPPGRTV